MVLVCSLCLAGLVACGRTRPAHIPSGSEALPPVVESVPDDEEQKLGIEESERLHLIHERLFREARQHFEAQEFQQAIQELTRLVALHPAEGLEQDAHWLLGQSYDRVGDWEASQKAYGILASAPFGQRYQAESLQRIHEIQDLLEQIKGPPQQTQAIRFALNQLPGTEGFDQGIAKMKQDGMTTLLIDLGCQRSDAWNAASESSPQLQDLGQLQEVLRSFTERSHRAGLLLYVGVNLRCLGSWAPSESMEWRDRTYQVSTGTFHASTSFDLFHSGYQRFLLSFLSRLCKDGVNGLVFLDDQPLGMLDGMSPLGLKRFESQFGTHFEPSQVFYQGFNPLAGPKGSEGASLTSEASSRDALFWRWAGWKARERLTIVEALVDRLRLQYRSVQFGLEVHPHALTDPVRALVEYAEDAMDATGRPFSFFFVRPELNRRSSYTDQAVIAKLRRISTKAVLDRLLPAVDDPRRVWVSMPAKGGQRLRSEEGSSDFSPLEDFPSGIGVVHDLRAFS
ncbi:MAG: hypothetical protein OEY91_03345 [Nitrospirota bacterium]|nr:hypothetical protein [Nitrospirota bacterium]